MYICDSVAIISARDTFEVGLCALGNFQQIGFQYIKYVFADCIYGSFKKFCGFWMEVVMTLRRRNLYQSCGMTEKLHLTLLVYCISTCAATCLNEIVWQFLHGSAVETQENKNLWVNLRLMGWWCLACMVGDFNAKMAMSSSNETLQSSDSAAK